MKKLTFLLFFATLAFYVQAGAVDWAVGRNHIHNLLDAIEKSSDGEEPPTKYQDDGSDNLIDTKDHFIGIVTLSSVDVKTYYGPEGDNKYYPIVEIDWKDRKYQQKSSEDIELNQPDPSMFPSDDDGVRKGMEEWDLRWLEEIDFSGNYFRSIFIDGLDTMTLRRVNLSRNPTLEYLAIYDCPDLEYVDVTYCELDFETIEMIDDYVELSNGGVFNYTRQGVREAGIAHVDITELINSNGKGTQASWSVEPASTDGNVYTFESVGDIVLTLTNSSYSDYTIEYEYSLISGTPVTINKNEVNCEIVYENLSNPGRSAVVDDEIKITVTPTGYYNLVEFSINGAAKDLDENNQYVLALTEDTYTISAEYVKSYSGLGDGSVADPYQVANQLQLNQVRYYPSASFVLTEDIDLVLSGQGWEPIANFEGVFDGNGKGIHGLMINRPTGRNVGLFAQVKNNGVVENLAVSGTTINAKDLTGGIVGILSNDAKILGCFFSGDIDCSSGEDVGGIVGWVEHSALVENCYSTANVAAKDRAGGVVGRLRDDGAEVKNSYATGIIWADPYSAGGVVGSYNAGSPKVTACFALNPSVDGNNDANRIIGWDNGSVKTNNYAFEGMELRGTLITDGETDNSNGANISLEEIKTVESYTAVGWDFDNVWEMGVGSYDLPVLKNAAASVQPQALPVHLDEKVGFNLNTESLAKVYPTITQGIIRVVDKNDQSDVSVFTISGMKVMQSKESTLDLSALANGVYFVHVEGVVVKVLKK